MNCHITKMTTSTTHRSTSKWRVLDQVFNFKADPHLFSEEEDIYSEDHLLYTVIR